MEDLLDLYAEPYDPRRPVVCFDETSTQLLAETRPSLPPRPGIPLRQDYEYRREGVRNLFLACEPLAGWRHVAVTQRRTMEDFAHQMRWLVDEAYPETPVVRVVMDNLNTHRPASLYETFPAPEARRIAKRLEFHYTPKHGSWLNMAEIEFSVLSRSCLKQRLPDEETLHREVQALVKERNAAQATIQWRFKTQDARTKLHRLSFDSNLSTSRAKQRSELRREIKEGMRSPSLSEVDHLMWSTRHQEYKFSDVTSHNLQQYIDLLNLYFSFDCFEFHALLVDRTEPGFSLSQWNNDSWRAYIELGSQL